MGPLRRGECRAVERQPCKEDRGHLVVPDERGTERPEDHAERHLDGEHRHQRDDQPLQQPLVAPGHAKQQQVERDE